MVTLLPSIADKTTLIKYSIFFPPPCLLTRSCILWNLEFPFPLFPLDIENKHMKCEVWGSANSSKLCVYVCCVTWIVEEVGRNRVGWSIWSRWGKIENSCDLFFPLLFQFFSFSLSHTVLHEFRTLQSERPTFKWLFWVTKCCRAAIKRSWQTCILQQNHTFCKMVMLTENEDVQSSYWF